jgi:hypothetical protein
MLFEWASPARRDLLTARAAAAQALRKTGTGGSLDENNLERLFWRENHAVRWAPGSAAHNLHAAHVMDLAASHPLLNALVDHGNGPMACPEWPWHSMYLCVVHHWTSCASPCDLMLAVRVYSQLQSPAWCCPL